MVVLGERGVRVVVRVQPQLREERPRRRKVAARELGEDVDEVARVVALDLGGQVRDAARARRIKL